ncbi:MAG: isochorismatase family protein [Thiotrichales bacterium]
MAPLCRAEESLLLCVDMQDRLLDAMVEPARTRMLENTEYLLKTASMLSVPVFYTEQYPEGLGKTTGRIKEQFPADVQYYAKTEFSCCAVDDFSAGLRNTHKRQIVLVGMETHICVMQTALELLDNGFEVFIADDAVCSQRMAHWKSALNRLRMAGAIVAPTESILFEWIRDAKHEHFKAVSALFR